MATPKNRSIAAAAVYLNGKPEQRQVAVSPE